MALRLGTTRTSPRESRTPRRVRGAQPGRSCCPTPFPQSDGGPRVDGYGCEATADPRLDVADEPVGKVRAQRGPRITQPRVGDGRAEVRSERLQLAEVGDEPDLVESVDQRDVAVVGCEGLRDRDLTGGAV